MATITNAGAVPDSPIALRDAMIAAATALSPGLTVNLPGSLIEDMGSTAAGALVVQDQAYVDLVNSISPTTANDFILTQLGNVYGVAQGIGSNASVYVTFSGTVGFVINAGFVVSDGTYQYTVQEATIVATGGSSAPVYCVATVAGTWAIPANTVTSFITSVPVGVTLTCTNTSGGIPGQAAQSTEEYRLQVIQAGRAVSTGIPTLLKTALRNVSGVVARLISVQVVSGGYEIIVGGGDPYAVANAIFQSMFNILDLQGTQGFVGMGSIAGNDLTITSTTSGTLGIGSVIYGAGITPGTIITSGTSSPWTVSPSQTVAVPVDILTGGNTQIITINDYPDSYNITFVVPFQQTVTITVNWLTAAGTDFVSNTVVAGLVSPAIAAYINTIFVGQGISLLELQAVFLAATVGVIDPVAIVKLDFVVNIDGNSITPISGGIIYPSNLEGWLSASQGDILVLNS
jgi:hypothetical protein